jgi:hypothetical protein
MGKNERLFCVALILLLLLACIGMTNTTMSGEQMSILRFVSVGSFTTNRTTFRGVKNTTTDAPDSPPATFVVVNTSSSSSTSVRNASAAHDVMVAVPASNGLIVIELMGRLGNNFFQLGFAHILAQRLLGAWEMVIIPHRHLFYMTRLQCASHTHFPVFHEFG